MKQRVVKHDHAVYAIHDGVPHITSPITTKDNAEAIKQQILIATAMNPLVPIEVRKVEGR